MTRVPKVVVLAAAATLLAVACDGGRAADPSPSPTPTETPTTPDVEPVSGAVELDVRSVHNGAAVFNAGDPNARVPSPDEAAIQAFVQAVQDWLNRHLTDLRAGGEGLLAEVAAPGLLAGAAPEAVVAVTTALTGQDRPVSSATYRFLVAEAGPPQWCRVTVDVAGPDGSVAAAEFVFTPGDPRPVLLGAGPAQSGGAP